jgi:hypothetical protein
VRAGGDVVTLASFLSSRFPPPSLPLPPHDRRAPAAPRARRVMVAPRAGGTNDPASREEEGGKEHRGPKEVSRAPLAL